MRLRIGTRGSQLALIQTQRVVERLKTVARDLETEIEVIRTSGDTRRATFVRGMFVNEINRAVLDGRADIGVHSLKDLPTELPEGLSLASVPERLSPNDVLVTRDGVGLDDFPPGSVIGTSSPRRRAEISCLRQDLKFKEIRGNVDTRVKKVMSGLFDGLVTSWAALERLGLQEKTAQKFSFEEVVPAAGQGALGVVRRSDYECGFLTQINDERAYLEVICERAFLAELRMGCKACAGAVARAEGERIKLIAAAHDENGRHVVRLEGRDASELGGKAARKLK